MTETGPRAETLRFKLCSAALSLAAALSVAIVGCSAGSNSVGATTATITSVTVSCTPTNILTNQTSACTSTVVGTGNYSSGTSWLVSPVNIGSVSASGVFTPSSAGTATITANSTQDSTKSGSATVIVAPPPPSNLSYPQTTLSATVGQPITPDTPAVTGSVSTYSVSPALPAGLSLNTTTGTISGTPTATGAQTTYTVTAANTSGNTTTTIQIAVVAAAPSNLAYPQATISATVGLPITPDTPTVTSSISAYSVSPALPAGLSLNATSGTISGTPTATIAQTSYIVTATNTSGSTTATVQITVNPPAPSNLTYFQPTLSITIGQTIPGDEPSSVTGTVSSYSISPALPAGLQFSTTTGSILGTPTVASPQTTYTITASNAGGLTTATVQITVTPLAPTNLVYPQATITAIAGQAITPDIPNFMQTASFFSVSPALPAGLLMDSSTGTISGTPTSPLALTSYTVTASNAGGSTTATVKIAVLSPQNILLDLGHGTSIQNIKFLSNRVLSADLAGHWVLWNYTSAAILASGDGARPDGSGYFLNQIDMAGQIVVDAIANGLEIRAISDGHLLATITYPNLNVQPATVTTWWQLATDGSYICIGSPAGLFVYTTSGKLMASEAGDYSRAKAFSAPGQVLIGLGPAGKNLIETFSTTTGSSSLSPTFSGNFNSWFLDGNRFLTNISSTVWVYSNTGVQQAVVSLPTANGLTGQGNWISTFDTQSLPNPIAIYPIGSATPSLTTNNGVSGSVIASGTTLAILPNSETQPISIIDLSGPVPQKTDYTVPTGNSNSFAAISATQWIAGNSSGVLLDGATVSSTPRYFGQGKAWSIAGTSGTVAIGTAIGQISIFNPTSNALQQTIAFPGSQLAISTDGSVLGAFDTRTDFPAELQNKLNFYSLPSASVINSFTYALPDSVNGATGLRDFSLSASGTTIGQVTDTYSASATTGYAYARSVTPITGGPAIWSDSGSGILQDSGGINPILLSPDGTLIATSLGPKNQFSATNIFQNGTLLSAVPGIGVGWIDNTHLFVKTYNYGFGQSSPSYSGSAIYSPAGVQLSQPPLYTEFNTFQTVNSNSLYNPADNSIYSLVTGRATWTGSFPTSAVGSLAGAYVVYQTGHWVVVETY